MKLAEVVEQLPKEATPKPKTVESELRHAAMKYAYVHAESVAFDNYKDSEGHFIYPEDRTTKELLHAIVKSMK